MLPLCNSAIGHLSLNLCLMNADRDAKHATNGLCLSALNFLFCDAHRAFLFPRPFVPLASIVHEEQQF